MVLLRPIPGNLNHAMVQGLMTESGSQWDDEILRDIFNDRDISLVKKIPIPLRRRSDTWFWLMEEK